MTMLRNRSFLRRQDGAAAVEFAFVFPIFLVLLVGVIEMGNYIIARIKTDNAAYVMDLVASTLEAGPNPDQASLADFTSVTLLLDGLLDRYDGADTGGTSGVRITAVNRCPAAAVPIEVFNVDASYAGGGTALSKIDAGTLEEGQGAYIVEVNNTYAFLFGGSGWIQSVVQISPNANFDTDNVVLQRTGGLIQNPTTGATGC